MPKPLKPAHSVRVTEDFDIVTELGALVVTEPRTGATHEIAPAKTHTQTYKEGTLIRFGTKKDAIAFWKQHLHKVMYMGKV